MRSLADLAGKYELKVGGEKWESRLVGAEFHQEVDGFATLNVAIATTPVELAKLKISDYPATGELSWMSKALFRGTLVGVQVNGSSQVVLTYGDDLRAVGKRTTDQFGKQKTLEDTLRKIAAAVEMRPRFQGDFSEQLPSFPQGGRSQLALLTTLADEHGFFFVTRSVADELVFFRPGQQVASATLDAADNAGAVNFGHSGEAAFDKIALRYFDAKTLEPKESRLGADELYRSISGFTGGKEKRQWKASKGEFETHVTDSAGFERAEAWLSAHFSKRALSQERITVRCHEPFALPGDKLEISKSPAPTIEDGSYLVVAISVSVGASIPGATITAMRA